VITFAQRLAIQGENPVIDINTIDERIQFIIGRLGLSNTASINNPQTAVNYLPHGFISADNPPRTPGIILE